MTQKKDRNSLDFLLETMQALRAPDGCPWDAEQTPESLAPYIMEEACELIDAIEDGNQDLILDELGDLLLQVVFQAQIFMERKQFDFYAVADGIACKLVRRHPHVFDRDGSNLHRAELDKQWDKIKSSEATHNKSCLADHLPRQLPALQRAQKLISKAYRFDRQTELSKSREEIRPDTSGDLIKENLDKIDEQALGQALFDLVELAHDNDLDAETALRKLTRKITLHLDNN